MRRTDADGFVCSVCMETIFAGQCKCPEPEHADGLGRDALELLLEDADRVSKKLRASRDSQAIQSNTANTKMLINTLRGHL